MKIAISSDGPDLEARVKHRLGTAHYLVIVDIDSGDYEAVPNTGALGKRGAGIQAVVLAVSRGVETIVTGYCSPAIADQLKANGIEVLTGISETVGEVIERYRRGELKKSTGVTSSPSSTKNIFHSGALAYAVRSSAKQFVNILPVLIGVVLLIGLFNAFITKEFLASIFSGNMVLDTLWGACFGSILAGNPINSYIIGGELLKYDIRAVPKPAWLATQLTVPSSSTGAPPLWPLAWFVSMVPSLPLPDESPTTWPLPSSMCHRARVFASAT